MPATPAAFRFAPSPWVDWAKAMASQFIIRHHFAFYGPMIDRVEPWAPDVASWLVDQARLAVQVFLVVSGYLAARSLWPRPGQPRVAAADWLGLVALAVLVSLLLVWQPMNPHLARSALQPVMSHLARISYATFLVHYPLLLLVGSLLTRLWPDEPMVHATGLLLAWALALLAGWTLWHWLQAPRAGPPRQVQPLAASLPASSSSAR